MPLKLLKFLGLVYNTPFFKKLMAFIEVKFIGTYFWGHENSKILRVQKEIIQSEERQTHGQQKKKPKTKYAQPYTEN